MSKYLRCKALYEKALIGKDDWRKILESEGTLNELLDNELLECEDITTMSRLIAFDLSNYEELSHLSPRDTATCLETRAWYLVAAPISTRPSSFQLSVIS